MAKPQSPVVILMADDDPDDLTYATPVIGPDGTFLPAGAYFCDEGWIMHLFDNVDVDGTPGILAPYGDFSGDGTGDLFVWRPTNGQWYWLTSDDAFASLDNEGLGLGSVGDVPLVCDMDGDGVLDPLVWRS